MHKALVFLLVTVLVIFFLFYINSQQHYSNNVVKYRGKEEAETLQTELEALKAKCNCESLHCGVPTNSEQSGDTVEKAINLAQGEPDSVEPYAQFI